MESLTTDALLELLLHYEPFTIHQYVIDKRQASIVFNDLVYWRALCKRRFVICNLLLTCTNIIL